MFPFLQYLTLGADAFTFLENYSSAPALCSRLTRLSIEIGWRSFPENDTIQAIFALCPNIIHLCFQIRTWGAAESCAQEAFEEWDQARLLPSTLKRVLILAFAEVYSSDNDPLLADLRLPCSHNDDPRMAMVALIPTKDEASARRVIARTTRDNAFGAASWGNLDARMDDFYDMTDRIIQDNNNARFN